MRPLASKPSPHHLSTPAPQKADMAKCGDPGILLAIAGGETSRRKGNSKLVNDEQRLPRTMGCARTLERCVGMALSSLELQQSPGCLQPEKTMGLHSPAGQHVEDISLAGMYDDGIP